MPDKIVDLVLWRVVGQALQQLGKVLLAIEVVSAFVVVQIPGDLFQLLECRQKIGRLSQRCGQTLDHLFSRESLYRVNRCRQTSGQQQRP